MKNIILPRYNPHLDVRGLTPKTPNFVIVIDDISINPVDVDVYLYRCAWTVCAQLILDNYLSNTMLEYRQMTDYLSDAELVLLESGELPASIDEDGYPVARKISFMKLCADILNNHYTAIISQFRQIFNNHEKLRNKQLSARIHNVAIRPMVTNVLVYIVVCEMPLLTYGE